MNERLKQFLAMESLTPGQFAEIMGIQRSGISHLLSGRNNPSYEFIQKMMTCFPTLNAEWLILGKGKPYKDSSRTEAAVDSTPNDDIKTRIEVPENVTQEIPEDMPDFENGSLFAVSKEVSLEKTRSEAAENKKFDAPAYSGAPKCVRRIERITVYYNDGTYEDR